MRLRPLLLASFFFAIGATVYLSMSGATPQLKTKTVLCQALMLIAPVVALSALENRGTTRWIVTMLTGVVMSCIAYTVLGRHVGPGPPQSIADAVVPVLFGVIESAFTWRRVPSSNSSVISRELCRATRVAVRRCGSSRSKAPQAAPRRPPIPADWATDGLKCRRLAAAGAWLVPYQAYPKLTPAHGAVMPLPTTGVNVVRN